MGREDFHVIDPLYFVLPSLDSLGQVPKIKINQHAVDLFPWSSPDVAPQPQDLVPHSLDTHDACCSQADLLVRPRQNVLAIPQLFAQRRRVHKYAKMMEDLGDAVVGEHCQGGDTRAGTVGEERMRARGVCGKEGGPRFGHENLGTLPEEDPVSAEGSLVSKTRKGLGNGLDEFQCGPSAPAGSLEDAQEARVRSAKVIAEDGPGLPHDRNAFLE